MSNILTEDLATRFARIALGHVRQEYPNNLDHALAEPADARTPSQLHPIFYGSYDWHSCVHSYWLLAYLLRRFPGFSPAEEIHNLFEEQFTAKKVAGECAYFARPTSRGFKRPYGWAWLLKLAAELTRHEQQQHWYETLRPLAEAIEKRFSEFLPHALYPVRVGTHFNTAFALRMTADYADAIADSSLASLLSDTARLWYGGDRDCPSWGEPGLDDFQSPSLIEAECMRRLLPKSEFVGWFEQFLPHIGQGEPAVLFKPAIVTDRTDGKIAHLDGLNLSRAWCWRSLAKALPAGDPRRVIIEKAAKEHLEASLPHIDDDYMGGHWLASFAVLALDVRV